eukprot:925717_1
MVMIHILQFLLFNSLFWNGVDCFSACDEIDIAFVIDTDSVIANSEGVIKFVTNVISSGSSEHSGFSAVIYGHNIPIDQKIKIVSLHDTKDATQREAAEKAVENVLRKAFDSIKSISSPAHSAYASARQSVLPQYYNAPRKQWTKQHRQETHEALDTIRDSHAFFCRVSEGSQLLLESGISVSDSTENNEDEEHNTNDDREDDEDDYDDTHDDKQNNDNHDDADDKNDNDRNDEDDMPSEDDTSTDDNEKEPGTVEGSATQTKSIDLVPAFKIATGQSRPHHAGNRKLKLGYDPSDTSVIGDHDNQQVYIIFDHNNKLL